MAPVVFQDCIRFLSKRSLTNPHLFSGEVDKTVILSLKQQYEQGRRPLRSKKNRGVIEDSQVANLLLLWLGSLPRPLFPVEHVWHLANLIGNSNPLYQTLKVLIASTEPFILEVLFPLFELLHHFHLNEECRDESLCFLSAIFTPSVFGTKEDHGLRGAEYDALLKDSCAMLIKEYRGLFMSKPELVPVSGSDLVQDPTAEFGVHQHQGDISSCDTDCEKMQTFGNECNKKNLFEDALDGMVSLTFERILESLDSDLTGDLEASPQKRCKTGQDSSTKFLFMNQFKNKTSFDRIEASCDTSSPTSVL